MSTLSGMLPGHKERTRLQGAILSNCEMVIEGEGSGEVPGAYGPLTAINGFIMI